MLGLVFGGGGAKGSYEIGVWKALIDMDIEIDVVTGTSIGSLNAAMVAQGDFKKGLDGWYNFDAGKMFGIDNYDDLSIETKTKKSFETLIKDAYKNGGNDIAEYRKIIEDYVDEQKVRNSKIKMGLVTVKREGMKGVELSIGEIEEGKLTDYIMASSSIAVVFKPQEIDGKKYIDGGYHDNIPINLAKRLGANEFIVVDLKNTMSKGNVIKKHKCPEDIKYISPYWDLGNIVVFDKESIRKNIQQGYFDTMKKFGAFDGNAYTFIKKDFRDNFLKKLERFLEKSYKDNLEYKVIFKAIELEYQSIIKNHNSRGTIDVSDTLCILEILAEILEIDYTKIYSRENIHKRIKEELEKIEVPDFKINKMSDIKNLIGDLRDLKKVLKFFVNEIKEDREEWLNNLRYASIFYDKVFFASMYAYLYDLI